MLELKNICKSYKNSVDDKLVLKNINFKINKGELVSIVGPSGSGKSTLINIIGLMDTYDSGEYIYNDKKQDISELTDKELAYMRNSKFGFVYQNFALINEITIMENLKLPLVYKARHEKIKLDKKIVEEKIKKYLDKFGLLDKINNYPFELSGGQQQRIAIIRAIINDAEVILADEPTGALDREMSNTIFEELLELNKKGKTIIIVTHNLEIANKCTRKIKIIDGVIKE